MVYDGNHRKLYLENYLCDIKHEPISNSTAIVHNFNDIKISNNKKKLNIKDSDWTLVGLALFLYGLGVIN